MIRFFKYSCRFKTPFQTAAGVLGLREGLFVCDDRTNRVAEIAPLPPFSDETLENVLRFIVSNRELESWGNAPFASLRFAMSCLQSGYGSAPVRARSNGLVSIQSENYAGKTAELVQQGFYTIKTKIGIRPEEEIDRLNILSDQFPEVTWRLDANGSFSVPQALNFFERIAGLRVDYIEQPVGATDISGLAILKKARFFRIFADESVRAMTDLERLIAENAVDGVVLKPQAFGSIQEVETAVSACKQHGISVTLTTLLETYAGRWYTASLAQSLLPDAVHGLATGGLLLEDTALERLENGQVLFDFLPVLDKNAVFLKEWIP